MSEISALPGAIVAWLREQEALSSIKFITEFPASRKSVPLTATVVAVGIDEVTITDSFTENDEGVLEKNEYCRCAEIRIRLGIHAPFADGGEKCYSAFTDVIDTLTFASDLEITDSGCEGITADRDTDAFVLTAHINVKANLCPAASCSVQFASFMDKTLLCGSHIRNTDIHLNESQQAFLSEPFACGTYFGNGASARTFSLGFRPEAVLIFPQGTADISMCAAVSGDGSMGEAEITETGFRVKNTSASILNEAGYDYFYIAMR